MKFTLSLLSAAALVSSSAAREVHEVSAESKFGQSILSKARQLNNNNNNNQANGQDQTWIANMSLKFMGCHKISQWNAEADGEEDVRIETKRLAKFRLCPSNLCSDNKGMGCKKGFGDYIVDLDDFLASYLENKQEVEYQNCQNHAANKCNCGNADDQEYCLNKCYKSAGMYECIQNDEYYGNQFQVENYLECAQWEPSNNQNANGRALAYYQNQQEQYYIGSYCSAQGGAVNLGVFTDDACTVPADSTYGRSTYYKLEGKSLPYGEESIVNTKCWSCEDNANQAENGYYVQAMPKQACTDVYDVAGKCETYIQGPDSNDSSNTWTYFTRNTNGCGYMSGIQTWIGSNGIINRGNRGGNKVASAFIGIFGIAFVGLGSYVYFLKTKLDRGRINLSD